MDGGGAGGKKQFDFRIGAGGAISEMRDCTDEDQPLLAPTNKGEVTDRVIQWTAWSESVNHRVAKLPKSEWRYNVTQGGTNASEISPTVSVRWDKSANVIDVYSVPQDQWKTEQQPHMKGNLSALTRYEGMADGVLKIRRVVRVGDITLLGKPAPPGRMIFEAWTPFRHSGKTFDSLALSLDEAGKPNWWYEIGHNLPKYPKWPVNDTKGYAVVFRASSRRSTTPSAWYSAPAPSKSTTSPPERATTSTWTRWAGTTGSRCCPACSCTTCPPAASSTRRSCSSPATIWTRRWARNSPPWRAPSRRRSCTRRARSSRVSWRRSRRS